MILGNEILLEEPGRNLDASLHIGSSTEDLRLSPIIQQSTLNFSFGEESQSLCPMEAEGTNSTLSDDKEVSKLTPREESQSRCPMEAEGTNSTLSDDKEVSKLTPREESQSLRPMEAEGTNSTLSDDKEVSKLTPREESQSLCPMEAEGTNSTLSDDKEVSKLTPRRIRCSSSGKFQMKTDGTPEQLLRRQKDRDRKKLIRGLSVFDKMIQYANANEDASFFGLIQKDVEIHFCGSEAYVDKFKDNKPICEYKENTCIETRKDSVLRRINRASAKKNAVKPSPTKVSASLSFLPGLSLKDQQKDTLRNFHPDQTENLITLDQTTIENIQSKIFVRQRRKNPKQRLNLIENDENVTSKKSRGRGRGRGRGK